MPMNCPQCSARILESQRFCRYCGYRLDQGVQDYIPTETFTHTASSPPSPGPYSSASAPWMAPAPTMNQAVPTAASRRGRRFLVLLSGLLLCCAIGGAVVFKAVSDRSSRSGPPIVAVVQTSYLGVNFDEGEEGGAFIDGVTNGGPADQAGLIGGDLIIEANGQPIRSSHEMSRLLASTPPGTQLRLKILRDGQPIELLLTTGARRDFEGQPTQDRPHGFFGIDPGAAERVRVPGTNIWGVQLGEVIANRPADLAGIREGDIIIEFNGHAIRTPRELLRRINQTEPYATVNVKVMRDGQELVIPVKMGRSE